ncbi:coiled-coil domain-containing protein [Clostridium culturomicium]|uniref:hypothetical protein n=1 Tax=Clostridium culturomicium TaxID=1499683 RepID=UPI00058F62C2|nr:hypothetical protein [Clostridium culturomicium]
MYITSDEYKETIKSAIREFDLEMKIAGKVVENIYIQDLTFEYDMAPADEFIIGQVICPKLTFNVHKSLIIGAGFTVEPTIKVKVGLNLENIPMGKFYVADIKEKGAVKTITCYDYTYKLNTGYFSELSFPSNTTEVMNEIASKLKLSIDGNIPTYPIVTKPEGMVYRELMGYIASLCGGNFRFNRAGKIELLKMSAAKYELDTDRYTNPVKQDSLYKLQKITCSVSEEEALASGTVTDGIEMVLTNPYMTQSRLDEILFDLKALSFYPLSLKMQGDPSLDIGDIISVTLKDGSKVKLPLMRVKYRYAGSFGAELMSVAKSPEKKKAEYKGSITQKIENIVTEQIILKELVVNSATIENLVALRAELEKLIADKATIGQLEALDAEIQYLNATKATIEALKALEIKTKELIAEKISVEEFEAEKASIIELIAQKISVEQLNAVKATLEELIAKKASIEELDAVNIRVDKLEATTITVEVLEAYKAVVNELLAKKVSAEEFEAQKAEFKVMLSKKATIEELEAYKATINELLADMVTTEKLTAELATIKKLIADKVSAEELEAFEANITKLIADKATIGQLIALEGKFNTLKSNIIETINLSAEEAVINSARIGDLSALKITSGLLDTSKVRVVSPSGNLSIEGNTIQIRDKTPIVRVQIGEDAQKHYGIIVRDLNGDVIFDSDYGVYEGGIKNDAVTTDKIKDDSITPDKIIIKDLFAFKAFIENLQAVTIDVKQLVVSNVKIKGDMLDLEGAVSFSSLSSDFDEIFKNGSADGKTYINGGAILTESVTADKIKVKGLTVNNKNNTPTFQITEDGDTLIDGTLSSSNFTEKTGYKITPDGNAVFNQATIRGNIILPKAGITDYGNLDKSVRIWAGASYEDRETAPFKVYQDGTVSATRGEFGGTFTGQLSIGNIHISDTNTTKAKVSIKDNNDIIEKILLTDEEAQFDVNFLIGTSADKRIEYIKDERNLNIRNTKVNYFGSTTNINIKDSGQTELVGNGGGHHVIKQLYGETLNFDSKGVSSSDGDFYFTRKDKKEYVKVTVEGELSVSSKITSKNHNIEIRHIKSNEPEEAGIGFYIN